jgi:hypothetical protein
MSKVEESKRIKKFRSELVNTIPRVPNNKESLDAIKSKHLTSLLIIYCNWRIRFVRERVRKVGIEKSAKNDPRWNLLSDSISSFLEKVEKGDDLTPFLSLQTKKRGFLISANNGDDSWDDKDFLLNLMGFHHFHLGEIMEGASHAERTDEVLFAAVTKDTFTVLAILNHSVFESPEVHSEPLKQDREYLWSIFDERSMRNALPGSIIMPSMIATSGHSVNTVMAAQEYSRVIREIDPKLDDWEFVQSLYDGSGINAKNTETLKWHFRDLDLGVLDEKTGFFGVFRYGPN